MRQTPAAKAADHYVQRLDLGTDPFVEGFRADYFYPGGQRRHVLEQVQHFARFSDQVVMLLGSTGSGTSTVLDQLLDQLEPVMDFCALDAESLSNPAQMLTTLGQQLQLNSGEVALDNVPALVAALRYRAELDVTAEPLLIAVDQAHFLGMEGLELLRQIGEQAGSAVHLLLVGEYQVEQLARLAGFDGHQFKVLELEPLSVAETGEYLVGLLQSVGYAGEQPLSSDQLAVLHEQSGGNIAEINALAPTLLDTESKPGRRGVNLSIPISHIAAIGVLLVAIGLSYWYQGADDAGPADRSEQALALPEPTIPEPATTSPQADPVRAAPTSAESVAGAGAVERAPGNSAEVAGGDAGAPVTSGAEIADKKTQTVTETPPPPAQGPTGEKAPAEDDTAAAPTPGNRDGDDATATVPEPAPETPAAGAAEPKDEAAATAAKAPKKEPKADEREPAGEGAEPRATADATGEQADEAARVVDSGVPPRERRLLNMDADAFLLQLMGAEDEQRARAFVKQYAGRLPITYYESRRQSKPWFVVVTGPYADKDQARAGIAVLPERVRRQQPWVRSVASVQEDIRRRRQ